MKKKQIKKTEEKAYTKFLRSKITEKEAKVLSLVLEDDLLKQLTGN